MEIVSRNFPPGMKLSEQILCNRWNVSRTPIREALQASRIGRLHLFEQA